MSKAARLMIDPSTLSMAASIRAAAQAGPLLVLTTRALRDLAHELGGHDRAAECLLTIVEEIGRPVAVNLERENGSHTVFIAPRGWSDERLRGWIAGHHADLEAELGEIVRMGLP